MFVREMIIRHTRQFSPISRSRSATALVTSRSSDRPPIDCSCSSPAAPPNLRSCMRFHFSAGSVGRTSCAAFDVQDTAAIAYVCARLNFES